MRHPPSFVPTARRPRPLLVVLAAAVLLAAGCTGGGPFGATPVGEVVAGGTLERAAGGSWEPLAVGEHVYDGDRLRSDGESAEVALAEGRIRLAPGTALSVGDGALTLERGDLLVVGSLPVSLDELTAAGAGAYRLTAGIAPRLRVYDGAVAAERLGERRQVPSLRELSLSVRRLPVDPEPLDYRADDPWDRELMGVAIAFDAEVERLARGIDRRYGADPQPTEFYERFPAVPAATLPVLGAAAHQVQSDEELGPPSETLLSVFVAQAAAEAGARVDDAIEQVVELRLAGARWGLVAHELGVSATQLAAAVDLEQERLAAADGAEEAEDPDGGERDSDEPEPQAQPEPAAPPPQHTSEEPGASTGGGSASQAEQRPEPPAEEQERREPGLIDGTLDDVLQRTSETVEVVGGLLR